MNDMPSVDSKVTKPGYGYYGTVIRHERKHRTDWAVVLWSGAAYTVQEYPHTLTVVTERPDRVTPYHL